MINNVSVVIPVYNGEGFIARAIQSVMSQSVKPFEIIVVNDGSTDDTDAELIKFGNAIHVITIPNGGVSNARNLGIQASSGDIIAFLDADDVWFPDKLKVQLDVFEHNPDVGFCCCDYTFLEGESVNMQNHFSRSHDVDGIVFDSPLVNAFEVLITINFVGTCSNVMIRRNVIDKVGLFNVNYKQSEDYDLWLRCALYTQFYLLSTILLEKKKHETNLTNNFLETLLFHEQVIMDLKDKPMAEQVIARNTHKYLTGLALVRYDIGNLFYEANHKYKAFEYFFRGLNTQYGFDNIKLFLRFFIRKLIRTISFGLLKAS